VSALVDITDGPVYNHDAEEDRIEPGEWAIKACDQGPRDGEEHITAVVNLASQTIPPIHKNGVSFLGHDGLCVMNLLPWELWECPALHPSSSLHHAEGVLLPIGGIPDPVDKQVGDEECGQCGFAPRISGWLVICEIQCAVTVRQWDTSEVPESQHEAELLLIHVPGSGDKMLSFGARVGVGIVGHNQEQDFTRDVTVSLILTGSSRTAETEQNEPWDADLVEHLEVQDAEESRVELSTHEEIINRVASNAVLRSTNKRLNIGDETVEIAGKDGNRHERTEFIQERIDGKQASAVQDSHDEDSEVEAGIGRAMVLQLLPAEVSKRLAIAGEAGHEDVTGSFKNDVCPVDTPCTKVREGTGVDKMTKMLHKAHE